MTLRYVVRGLARTPLLTATVVTTLALGVGANTFFFMVTQRMVLRPLDIDEPERLVAIWEHLAAHDIEKGLVSTENFLDWRQRQRSFDDIAASARSPMALRIDSLSELGRAAFVTSGYHELIQARAAAGRVLRPGDYADPGTRSVVVVSHRLWRTRLGGDPGSLGEVIHLNDHPYTVVGVLEPATEMPRQTDLWLPVRLDDLTEAERARLGLEPSRAQRSLQVIGRLREGVNLRHARAEMDRIAAGLRLEHPGENHRAGTTVTFEIPSKVVDQPEPGARAEAV